MNTLELLLLIVTAITVGQAYYIWLSVRQRPAWWRRMDLHHVERLLFERFDRLENNLSRVVAGLHEDIDGLRQEIRAMAQLPPESQIPRLITEVHLLRFGAVLVSGGLLAVMIVVAYLVDQVQRLTG